jgi:phosphatidyl-myo-inositol dimannoside synthase
MLNNEFPPLGGGTGTVNQALFNYFKDVPDLSIDLVSSALGNEYEQERFSQRINIFKVPVNNRNLHHSSNRELLTYTARSLPFAYKLHRRQPYDLCFAWSAVPAGGVAWALQRLTGLHYIVRVSGPDIPGFEQRYRWLYPFLTPIIRLIWRSAEVVVAKCQSEVDMIASLDARTRTTIIPNGVDLEIFRPTPPSSENGPLRLLCVGRLIERKGQHHLIQAVKNLVDMGVEVILDLIGTGDSLEQYQSLVQKWSLNDRVCFLGYIPREQMPHYYSRSHIFVLPSYNEGMSIATLEAMASGLPVMVSGIGSGDNLVKHGINGYTFKWGDIDELVSKLENLGSKPSLLRSMGIASREIAKTYSWEGTFRVTLDLIKHIAQEKKFMHSQINVGG